MLEDVFNIYDGTNTPYPTEEDKKKIAEREAQVISKFKSNLYDFYKMEKAKRKLSEIMTGAKDILIIKELLETKTDKIIVSSYRTLQEKDVRAIKVENGILCYKEKGDRLFRYKTGADDNRYFLDTKTDIFYIIEA